MRYKDVYYSRHSEGGELDAATKLTWGNQADLQGSCNVGHYTNQLLMRQNRSPGARTNPRDPERSGVQILLKDQIRRVETGEVAKT